MKKLVLAALFVIFVSLSAQASASAVTNSVQAAIASGNFEQIEAIAAANPAAQGEIAMYLLQQSSSKIASNPALAAKIFAAATPYVAQVPANQSGKAAGLIASVVQAAGSEGFSAKNPDAASDIFAAGLNMSSQPNIIAQSPGLHDTTLASASSFVDKNPQYAKGDLKSAVSLAQSPGVRPTINNIGAQTPSAQ
jgi:hypothetical protein